MFPWEGERVVFLTATADLDAKTMALFLKRLDDGWALYKELVGKEPNRWDAITISLMADTLVDRSGKVVYPSDQPVICGHA